MKQELMLYICQQLKWLLFESLYIIDNGKIILIEKKMIKVGGCSFFYVHCLIALMYYKPGTYLADGEENRKNNERE